jgi:hypothetical protein
MGHAKQWFLLARVVEIRAREAALMATGLMKNINHSSLLVSTAKSNLFASIHGKTSMFAATTLLTLSLGSGQVEINHTIFFVDGAKSTLSLPFIVKEREDITTINFTVVNYGAKVDHSLLLVSSTKATTLLATKIKQANFFAALTDGGTNVTSHHSFHSMIFTKLTTLVWGESEDRILVAAGALALGSCILESIDINHSLPLV